MIVEKPVKSATPQQKPIFPFRVIRVVLRGLIRFYQLTFSALVGRQCRYLPTCSDYTSEAIETYGAWRGVWMGIARFSRCGPLGASGYDPVPENRAATPWYLPWRAGQWSGAHLKETTSGHSDEHRP